MTEREPIVAFTNAASVKEIVYISIQENIAE